MSAVVAAIGGAISGGLLAAMLAIVSLRGRACVDPAAHELTNEDREAVAAEFAAHTTAVRRGVSEYADALAGSDTELRERLRLFEGGGR
ncbi:hypothetical protein [Nocardioides pyridinolyticus]